MVMQENYQPVVLRKILLSKGATREEIEEELKKYNPESESKSMTNIVLTVLQNARNNMIKKEGDKIVINTSDEFTLGQIENLVSACNSRILTFTIRFFIALGPWSNWEHTLKNPPFRWGVNPSSASNVGVFNALRQGDVVYFYANQDPPTQFSNRGLFGIGKVIRKYDEDKELYWPDEKLKGEVIYKHRFEIEPLKLVKSDSELLPWIDGLPFTKGLNRIANPDTLEQLIDNTQKIWNIKLDLPKSNHWIWSVTPENWEILKEKNIWASKIGQNIRDRVRPGDKVIFYVHGTNEFQGIFEFVGEWYDAPKPVWSDETDSIIHQSQIKLNLIKIGSVKVYDGAHELKMFSNPDDKRLINLVLKGGGGYPSNNGKPIVYQDYKKLLELMENYEVNYWKISPGIDGELWDDQKNAGVIGIHFFDFGDLSSLDENQLREKIREAYGTELTPAKQANTFSQMRDFMKIKEGDVILANKGKSKILGLGKVVGPYKYRSEMSHPHTFPVEWYDTTEGMIPKQEGWMVTVIQLKKEDFEELTKQRIKYLLLRHSTSSVNQWRDDIGKKYHFGIAPNYTKLIPGSKTIWFDREQSDDHYWGYGEVSRIEKDSENNFYAVFDHFNYFNDPKKANPKTEDVIPKKGSPSTKEKIMNLPGWNVQNSILEITKDIYDEIVSGEEKLETFEDKKLTLLTPAEIKSGYAKISDELLIPEEKITEIVTALASGRHVLLAGPIGTGKTRLAKMIPEIFWDKVGGYYSEDHTATADWSTQDVIGGIYPKMEDGKPVYDIQHGCVVDTVRKNWENDVDGGLRIPLKIPQKRPPYKGTWLIIDEFNRADIDKAFGQLFTALRTRWLKIPTDEKGVSYKNLKIPEDYRIIGTLNTADKHFLFQLSDALKSRFAYIEIDIPKREQREKEIYYAMKNALDELGFDGFHKIVLDDKNKKIDKEKSEGDLYNRVMQAYYFLDTVRVFKKLGTAILKLIFQNLVVGTIMTENSKTSLDNALTSNLIPQLENISITFVSAIHAMHSDTLVSFLKEAYKSPNRQSYVEAFEKILDYLQIQNKIKLVSDFANGNIKIDNEEVWRPIQTAYDNKKKYFEISLEQIKQSMDDLIKSMVI